MHICKPTFPLLFLFLPNLVNRLEITNNTDSQDANSTPASDLFNNTISSTLSSYDHPNIRHSHLIQPQHGRTPVRLELIARHLRGQQGFTVIHFQKPDPTLNMGDIASTQTEFMCLPRELPDQIYSHLFTSTYRVETSPSSRLRNSSDDTQVVTLTGPDPGQIITLWTLFTFQKPSDRIAILQVNKTISEEVEQVLYKSSTFLFNIGSSIAPSTMEFGNIEALKRMQNIEVNLDLKAAFCYRGQASDQEAALVSAEKLLSLLADGKFARDKCIIRIDHFRDYNLLMGELPTTICQLAAFRMVELQIRRIYTCYRRDGLSNFADVTDRQSQQIFMHIDRILSGGLGSGAMGYDQDGVYCMRYHPRGSSDQRRSQKAIYITFAGLLKPCWEL